jgi:hypothetical protein
VVEQTRWRDGQLNLVSAAASVQRATSVAAIEAECGLGSREGPQVVRFLTLALELVLRWDGGGFRTFYSCAAASLSHGHCDPMRWRAPASQASEADQQQAGALST